LGTIIRGLLGDKETGARAALPIWLPVMARALADKPVEDFLRQTILYS